MFVLKHLKLKITILTGSLIILLTACIALARIQPALEEVVAAYTVPMGAIAGVSIGGAIDPSPTNTSFTEPQTPEEEFRQKRLALEAEQRYLERNNQNENAFLYSIIGLLTLLVLASFYFDIKRSRQQVNREAHA